MSKAKREPADQPVTPVVEAELPQVRVAHCGCILPADAKPIGYRFKLTQLGDVRTPVYACAEHDKTRGEPAVKKLAKRT